MIATLPPCKPPRSLILVQGSVAILLLLSPVFVKLRMERQHRASIAGEYLSSRSSIFSSIEEAVESQDFDTLTEINNRYAGYVSDGTFSATIREALATVAAREAALELAVSKHLDLLRHQEECTLPPFPIRSQTTREKRGGEQELSKLPR